MQSNLKVSVGLLGAVLYLGIMVGGTLPLLILGGYILLREENPWLRRVVVKGALLYITFALISAAISLLGDSVDAIETLLELIFIHIPTSYIMNILYLCRKALVIVEYLVYGILGLKALTQGTIPIPVIDGMINKHMGQGEN